MYLLHSVHPGEGAWATSLPATAAFHWLCSSETVKGKDTQGAQCPWQTCSVHSHCVRYMGQATPFLHGRKGPKG